MYKGGSGMGKDSNLELEKVDNNLFNVLEQLNTFMGIGVDFNKEDHDSLVLTAREILVDFLGAVKGNNE